MFPPKATTSITEWLSNMFDSLHRAGLEFSWDIVLDEGEEGLHAVRVQLVSPVPKKGWDPFKCYVQQYALIAGWRVKHLRQSGRFLTFRASSA